MNYIYNDPVLKDFRRELRKHQTSAENLLWQKLRNKKIIGFKFYRQYSIYHYILDFYCPQKRLGIEVDGEYHNSDETHKNDEFRTNHLNNFEINIIRFSNFEVTNNIERILNKISSQLI